LCGADFRFAHKTAFKTRSLHRSFVHPANSWRTFTYWPEWYARFDWETFPTAQALSFLKERGISYLLVYHNLLSDEESAAFARRMQKTREEWDGIVFVDQLGEVEIYDITLANLVDPSARAWHLGEPAAYLRYDFDMEEPLGSGWSGLENTGDGVTFVWSAEETVSSLTLPMLIVESDFIIRFRVFMAVEQDVLDSLKLYVNEDPIELSLEGNAEELIFRGVVSEATLLKNLDGVLLRFEINRLISPSDTDGNDTRKLGIAYDWLTIEPLPDGN
jgi:hypothetical protein